MRCLLPAVFAALGGAPPLHPGMHPPPRPHEPAPPPPGAGKVNPGDDLANHLESENFTVQWEDASITTERADAVLAVLEEGWSRLFEEQGWPRPVSSDEYRLEFVLDPSVPGSGYTTLQTSARYPDGYPVTRLNPWYGEEDYPGFALSVAVHELGHMSQYAVRDWSLGDGEPWFWEASAEWMAELGAPELDTYALSSYWYATQTELSADDTAGNHPYGMFLLAAWMDEELGAGTTRSAWDANDGDTWLDVLPRVTGLDSTELVASMAGAVGTGSLRESALYEPPERLTEGLDGPFDREDPAPDPLGSWYVDLAPLETGETLWVDGEVDLRLFADGEEVGAAPVGVPLLLVFTTPEDAVATHFTWGVRARGAAEPQACGCGAGGPASRLGLAAALLLATGRRRPSRAAATGG